MLLKKLRGKESSITINCRVRCRKLLKILLGEDRKIIIALINNIINMLSIILIGMTVLGELVFMMMGRWKFIRCMLWIEIAIIGIDI